MTSTDYWKAAGRNWNGISFPLLPGEEELDIYRKLLGAAFETAENILIMGVTQQFQTLGWPEGCVIEAADKSAEMIAKFWRGAPGDAILCDWRDIPKADGSYDAMMTDGGCILVPYPDGLTTVAKSVRRLLKPGGCFVTRNFVRPFDHPPFAKVRADLLAGRTRNISAYKLQAGMANSLDTGGPSDLRAVYERTMADIDLETLRKAGPFSEPEINSFEVYREAQDTYWFVDRDQFVAAMNAGGLELVAEETRDTEWGNLCPFFRFEAAR